MPAAKKLASPSTIGIHARSQDVGMVMQGPDGNMYIVAVRSNGSHYWKKFGGEVGTKPPKKQTMTKVAKQLKAKYEPKAVQKPKKLDRGGMTLAAVYDVKTKKAYQFPAFKEVVSEENQPFFILPYQAYQNMTGKDVRDLATLPQSKSVAVANYASYLVEHY